VRRRVAGPGVKPPARPIGACSHARASIPLRPRRSAPQACWWTSPCPSSTATGAAPELFRVGTLNRSRSPRRLAGHARAGPCSRRPRHRPAKPLSAFLHTFPAATADHSPPPPRPPPLSPRPARRRVNCYKSRHTTDDAGWVDIANTFMAMHTHYFKNRTTPRDSPLDRALRLLDGWAAACNHTGCVPRRGASLLAFDGVYDPRPDPPSTAAAAGSGGGEKAKPRRRWRLRRAAARLLLGSGGGGGSGSLGAYDGGGGREGSRRRAWWRPFAGAAG
jgi:hypothetical protein